MPAGGKQPGAGRKKGIPNKTNKLVREKAAATGELPLDYMLKVMRDGRVPKSRRDDMAKAAAPYLHSKMPVAITGNITHQGVVEHRHRMIHEVENITPQEAARLYEETLNNRIEFKPKLIANK